MTPIPYLFFRDDCAEALKEYARIFGSPAPEIMRLSDAPPGTDMPEGPGDAVMHGAVRVGDGWIYGSDDMGTASPAMAGSSVLVSLPDVEQARRAFEALSQGGEVRMPFESTFWSPGFGALTDRFGIRWMIGTDAEPSG